MDTPCFAAGGAFAGARLRRAAVCGANVPRMSLSRRDALAGAAGAAAAALLSGVGAALAKSGDAPKISVFGVGGASSPYTAGVQKGGVVQYKEMNSGEIELYKRLIGESKVRLESAIEPIKGRSWDDVRSRIRLEMSELRGVLVKLNDNISDKDSAEKANKAYADFKLAIENLDYAAITKDQGKAFKFYNAALKSLGAWTTAAGI